MSDIHFHLCPECQRRSQALQHSMAALRVASTTQDKTHRCVTRRWFTKYGSQQVVKLNFAETV